MSRKLVPSPGLHPYGVEDVTTDDGHFRRVAASKWRATSNAGLRSYLAASAIQGFWPGGHVTFSLLTPD
jgi:hypothetical protein